MKLIRLTRTNSYLKILNFSIAVTIISVLSSLPYFHEILLYKDGTLKTGVLDIGIQKLLIDENGKFFKYSSYRTFIYYLCFHLFMFFGWAGWYRLKTNKLYRKALLLPLISISYHLVIILSSARSSLFNDYQIKLLGTLIVFTVLIIFYYPQKSIRISKRIGVIWLFFTLVSVFPYGHDIITSKTGELRAYIPNLGVEEFLTVNDTILGIKHYRVFLYTVLLHVFAQIGWVGWFFDARNRLFRPFIIVPVLFNLYEITIILINAQKVGFNKPDWKLYTVIILSILIAINLYFNSDKALRWMKKKSINT